MRRNVHSRHNAGEQFIRVDEAGAGFWIAPDKFHGDHLVVYHKLLSYDAAVDAACCYGPHRVELSGGGITLSFEFDYPPESSWTRFQVRLDETANWYNHQTNKRPSGADFQAMLGNRSQLKILTGEGGEARYGFGGPDRSGPRENGGSADESMVRGHSIRDIGMCVRLRGMPAALAAAAGLAAGLAAAAPPEDHDVAAVHQDRVQLDFQVAPGSARITDVELWYTLDLGKSWRAAAVESGTQSPAVFTARQDGLHGLYLILHSEAGASARPPQPGDAPHAWVFVDRKPPIVQIRRIQRLDADGSARRLLIELAMYDAHFVSRPLSLDFRREGRSDYESIAADLTETDRYEWPIPPDVRGRIRIRALARDRGGNVGSAESAAIDLTDESSIALPANERAARPTPTRPTPGVQPARDATTVPASSRPVVPAPPALRGDEFLREAFDDTLRTARSSPRLDDDARTPGVIRLAAAHVARGEWGQAELRYRDALSDQPDHAEWRLGLANALYRQGKFAEARREYRAVLDRDGDDAGALAGLALIAAAQRDYQTARGMLQSLVRRRPSDPDAWIHLGDMAVLSGDVLTGRAAWQKARDLPDASEVARRRAEKRLLIYPASPMP